MKLGTLVKYYSIDDDIAYGIVTKYFKYQESAVDEPAVQVHWIDDGDVTLECIRNLLDPDIEYLGVVSESG